MENKAFFVVFPCYWVIFVADGFVECVGGAGVVYGIAAGLVLGVGFTSLLGLSRYLARKLGPGSMLPVLLVGFFIKLIVLVSVILFLSKFPAFNIAYVVKAFVI